MTTKIILPELVGTLTTLPEHIQKVIQAYGAACARVALQSPEIQTLRKDGKRYRYIRGGGQWIIATTQTGFHVDGEHLDELIDEEMEQQK